MTVLTGSARALVAFWKKIRPAQLLGSAAQWTELEALLATEGRLVSTTNKENRIRGSSS